MFEIVNARRRRESGWRSRGALAASAALHAALLIWVALLPPARGVPPRAAERAPEPVAYITLPSRPAAARQSPASSPAPRSGGPGADARPPAPLPPAPAVVPDRLPAPSLALSGGDGPPAPDSATLVMIQSIDAGALDARSRVATGQPLEPWMLATLPRLTNPRTMAGWWSELYPVRLLERGIQGEALIRFVIDLNGRVDPGTIEVLSASRPEFAMATVRGARMMRFRPAMFAGQRVRVRATLPVSWRLPEY